MILRQWGVRNYVYNVIFKSWYLDNGALGIMFTTLYVSHDT